MSERAAAMARRLAATAARAGMDEAGITAVERAFRRAMKPRVEHVGDDHDPDFLHPGRTALILLQDAGVGDPDVVAAGALCETRRPELRAPAEDDDDDATRRTPPDARTTEGAADRVRELLAQVPAPAEAGDMLLERLVGAPEPVRLVALAERLDHARHLHLRPRDEWREFYGATCRAYLPVAERTHPTLARRYRWWCRMFGRKYLGAPE